MKAIVFLCVVFLALALTGCIGQPDPLPLAREETSQAGFAALQSGYQALEKSAEAQIAGAEVIREGIQAQIAALGLAGEALQAQAEASAAVLWTATMLNITILLLAIAGGLIGLAVLWLILRHVVAPLVQAVLQLQSQQVTQIEEQPDVVFLLPLSERRREIERLEN